MALALGLTGCGAASGDESDRAGPSPSVSPSANPAVAEVAGLWNYLGEFQIDAATLKISVDGSATYVAGDDPTDYVGTVAPLKQASGGKRAEYQAELTGRGKTLTFTLRVDRDGRALHVVDEVGDRRIFARGEA